LLEPLADIDRPEDLVVWESLLASEERARLGPRLSVVIPTLNEESGVVAAIESARRAGAYEVIVADGGSNDSTVSLAAGSGALVIAAERGRARQLNAGARAACGDVLLFLHADTTLPVDAAEHVRQVMLDPDVALGSFRFSAGDPSSRVDRLISAVGDWRHRASRLPYGDQAPFVRAVDFADLGGFPDLPVMEDFEFALRCARLGRLGFAPAAVRTSTRAWHEHGLVRTTLTNSVVIAGYRLGVPATALAGWRRRIAERGEN
jgi:rSAM/selenodomain-associated transferase 2